MIDGVDFEQALGGSARYSAREIAEQAGVPTDVLVDLLAAAGLPRVEPGERRLTEADRGAAQRLAMALDSGLPAQRIVDANRVVGRAMAQVASALRSLAGDGFVSAGETEEAIAARYAAAARSLLPALGPALEHALGVQVRELVRRDVAVAARPVLGELAVAFASVVGFTWLGGQVPAPELGRVARRLDALAREVLATQTLDKEPAPVGASQHGEAPARVVKLAGDAVVLVSPDPAALLFAVLSLVEAAAAAGDGFPRLRAGIARGSAVERDGDVYGPAVDVAARLTAIARPGSVVTDDRIHDAVGRRAAWSFAGERRLVGLEGELRLFRARRLVARWAD